MTPKEKAEKLINSISNVFINDEDEHYVGMVTRVSKQCASIAVDEVLNVLPQHEYLEDRDEYHENRERLYWQEVKQEINNL
jgi:hypothetical protein